MKPFRRSHCNQNDHLTLLGGVSVSVVLDDVVLGEVASTLNKVSTYCSLINGRRRGGGEEEEDGEKEGLHCGLFSTGLKGEIGDM